MTDQNEGGGAADEPLPRFDRVISFGYSEYVPVYFKQEMVSDFGSSTLRPRNTVKVLDGGSFQDFRKPSGLNIFVEKQYGSNWVQHEFIYGR